ncbi:pyridoxamine 5'-phosphate oxidase family protein [Lutibacter sp.]|uniref:pyridoxamine 5'-phosphate oxidase family protein n=1 Tax=Lutibacter sp. TaxID=1925666 RepID=UPI002734B44D|nr:pyridoxamine 5'-phosphate oxidase family protein [Lutibacter sp.]MDP3312719.1 pyridoxamine 5'-phosphate oxidase family protein [Lutibacter sp.]
MKPSSKIKVKRIPKRGFYDKETIYPILDANFICQIAFMYEGYPVIIPTIYGRLGDSIYIHGATVSRMLVTLEKGLPISINVMQTNGIVLARSAFHHSLNYESVTVFGNATIITSEEERYKALEVISNQIIPGRWEEVRLPSDKELKATKILKIEINEASAKIRTGPPGDEKEDYNLPIWAGVIPLKTVALKEISDPLLNNGISISKSVHDYIKNNSI